MEAKIFQAKTNIVNCINAELNKGVPASVIMLILESLLPNLERAAIQIIEKENNTEENKLKETQESN